MFLDSIAAGVALAGIVLVLMVIGTLLWHQDKGSPWDAFKTPHGVERTMVSLTIFALLTAIGGIIGTITLGFTFESANGTYALTACAVTLTLVSVINVLAGRGNRKTARRKRTTTSRTRSAR